MAKIWIVPALLLAGLIAAESAFEDRAGSGNITDIQHNAERSAPRLVRREAGSFAEDADEPAWFSPDSPGTERRASPDPVAPLPAIPETGDLLGREGAPIPLPEQDFIERAAPGF